MDITPAGWTFSIWGVIYVWETLWLIYTIANIFRKTESGYAFNDPELLCAPFFVNFIVNMALNLCWIFLFDREHLEACFAVLLMMYITLYACLFLTYRALNNNLHTLQKSDRKWDIWLTRILVQNGISVYATWCTIATNLNLNMVLVYRSTIDISVQNGGTVALSIIAAQIVVFVTLDFFFWDKFTRYTLTPYLVIIVALIGSLSENYNIDNRNTIITLVLLTVGSLLFLVKVVLTIIRHIRSPILGVKISDSQEDLKKQPI